MNPKRLRALTPLLVILCAGCATAPSTRSLQEAGPAENVVVYNEPGRFAGWPANNGIWNWGDEIVAGFTLGYHKVSGGGHPIDRKRPVVPMEARSLNGSKTWTIERPSYLTEDNKHLAYTDCPGGIDFTQPDFALMFRMEHSNSGYSFFYWSNDRCRTWSGPHRLPTFDRKGVFARADYLVNGKTFGEEIILRDDGHSWDMGYPPTVQRADGKLVTVYYFNEPDQVERYIAATIWDPGAP